MDGLAQRHTSGLASPSHRRSAAAFPASAACECVTDILKLLAHGASFEEILTDHPSPVREDILAALAHAAQQTRTNP